MKYLVTEEQKELAKDEELIRTFGFNWELIDMD